MSFPQSVRDEALTLAARHCCVCHRYKGVGVEVHHVVQEADGGPNTLENAIALCFDCHAAAGHYNPRHPRGTKFSPSELRLARDRWHTLVASGSLDGPGPADSLAFRYVIDLGLISHLSDRARGDLGFGGSILTATSPLGRFLAKYRNRDYRTRRYADVRTYQLEHPEGRVTGGDDPLFAGYDTVRPVGQKEFNDIVGSLAPLEAHLHRSAGVPINDLVVAVGSSGGCGDFDADEICEAYSYRHRITIDLAITNMSDEPVTLDCIRGVGSLEDGLTSTEVLAQDIPQVEFKLPRAPLASRSTLVVPIVTILGPFDHWYPSRLREHASTAGGGPEEYDPWSLSIASLAIEQALGVLGPFVLPRQVHFRQGSTTRIEFPHGFDPERLYVTESGLGCGSCPHVFVVVNGRWRYLRAVLTRHAHRHGYDRVDLPPGSSRVRVAELEHEVTLLTSIRHEGTELARDVILKPGDAVEFECAAGILEFQGGYHPYFGARDLPAHRNALVTRELRQLHASTEL